MRRLSSASGDPYQLPGKPPGQLFPDTRCGPYNTSYLYIIQGRKGYRFTIKPASRYAQVDPHIQPILASFRSFALSPQPTAPPLDRQPARLNSLPVIGPENAAQLAPVARLGKGKIQDFALSPTANVLAAATPSGVYLYQMDTLAEERFVPTGHPALAVAFSPDGTVLATALADYLVRGWEVATGALRHTLTGSAERIYRLAFSPDGRQLAAVSGDSVLRSWETNTGRP